MPINVVEFSENGNTFTTQLESDSGRNDTKPDSSSGKADMASNSLQFENESKLIKEWNKCLSYNKSPQSQVPVYRIVESESLKPEKAISFYKWGMDLGFGPSQNQYSTFNCRVESLQNTHSAWYKYLGSKENKIPKYGSSGKGQAKNTSHRCVILAEGYYEWKHEVNEQSKSKPRKIPYFVTPTGNKQVYESKNDTQIKEEDDNNDKATNGRNVLFFAGLYNNGTVTIITKPAESSEMKWLHDREPVMLKSTDEVEQWLNGATVYYETDEKPKNTQNQPLSILYNPSPSIVYYRVSKLVGNTKLTEPFFVVPLTEEQKVLEDLNESKKSKKLRDGSVKGSKGAKVSKLTTYFSKKS